ncbi:MAG TPA: RNA methyltransferase [Thermoanaerobaculia bacterium]|nr:RNA methyltransferase [Thermoanaerobaculia bacterium]
MPTLRIVLVEPQEAGNVGAVARAMKNFGFDDLVVVGNHPPLLPVAGWWASGADDLLARARFAPTLQAAVADAHLTVATTSMRGRTAPADFTPFSLAEHFAGDQRIALVFGREDSGLTRDELALCQRTAVIPTNEHFPTMNLAQAVCVFCFALSQIAPREASRALAPAALVERMHERLESLLLQSGFLHANNPARIYDDIRAIFGRASLDTREATILLGIVHQLEWAISSRESDSGTRR